MNAFLTGLCILLCVLHAVRVTFRLVRYFKGQEIDP